MVGGNNSVRSVNPEWNYEKYCSTPSFPNDLGSLKELSGSRKASGLDIRYSELSKVILNLCQVSLSLFVIQGRFSFLP